MKRTNSCTTKKSFAEISIFLASKWFFISIFVVTILCYMTPVYYGDGVSEMSTLELLRLKANPSFAIEPMQYQISVILPRAVQGYLAMFVPVLSALPFIVFQQAEKSGRYQRFYMFRSTSSRQYYGKKWLFGMVTGGLVLLFGVILFELSFIAMDYYISGTITVGKSVEQLFYMQYYAGIFVYGAVSAIPAMLISFLCCNLYFIVCIPFIAVFMYNLLVSYLYRFADNCPIPHFVQIQGNLYSFGFCYIFSDVLSFVLLTIEMIVLLTVSAGFVALHNHLKLDLTD